MRFSVEKLRTLFLFCGITLSAIACVSEHTEGDVLRTTDYSVGPYTITEEVQYDYNDSFDDYYQRVYVVESQAEELAAFRGMTTMWGVETRLAANPPIVVDDWLAVFSLAQVWIWQPAKEAITFRPIVSLESDVWRDNGLNMPMNAADYLATDFQIKDGKWILEYTDIFPSPEDSPNRLKYIYFISEDQGQTFVPTETFPALAGDE